MNAHREYIIESVRRLGLSAFRIILILSALRILETYLQIAETLGIPVPSADRYINRWVGSGMIEKVGHGEFRRG